MSVIFIVLPLAITVVTIAVGAYIWSARGGQFDDLDTPAVRMLHDDDGPKQIEPPGSDGSKK
jgi:cbb3-type cytochrome oxidase maturation protein